MDNGDDGFSIGSQIGLRNRGIATCGAAGMAPCLLLGADGSIPVWQCDGLLVIEVPCTITRNLPDLDLHELHVRLTLGLYLG